MLRQLSVAHLTALSKPLPSATPRVLYNTASVLLEDSKELCVAAAGALDWRLYVPFAQEAQSCNPG